ncbi:MAG: tyrosine-type recombinase/integrase [Candidatus Bilamarchaeum sp.]
MKYDPHGKAERLKSMLEKIRLGKYEHLSKENSKLILEFQRDLVTDNLSAQRVYKYVETLYRIAKRIRKPMDTLTKEDIKQFVIDIETETKYSQWTKHDYKCVLKRFFKWLKGNNKEYPEEVSWIKVHVKDKHKLPEDLLTDEEIKKIINVTTNHRERAMITCLYESGCRISEILTIQMKNIRFDEYGAIVVVTGKTGDRRIRLISSVPALAAWIDLHPYKENPEAYLFVRKKYKDDKPIPYRYEYAGRIIKKLAAKAGIQKRVHPHLFRHSRATVLANKLTEAQMKEYFGWVQGSNMAATYVHLSGRDVDNAILGLHGVRSNKGEDQEKFKTIDCPRCSHSSSPGSKFCNRCGYSFNTNGEVEPKKELGQKDDLIGLLMKNPEFKNLILRELMQSGGLGTQINNLQTK